MLETKEELRDLRALMSSYSLADTLMVACGYAVMLAHLIGREHDAGLALDAHKEFLGRVLMLFLIVFIEVIYSLNLSLGYGVRRKRARVRLVRRHKWLVATGVLAWLLMPWLPHGIASATVVFAVLNGIAAVFVLYGGSLLSRRDVGVR